MQRATDTAREGAWPASEAVGSVLLDYDMRHRRRIQLECDPLGPLLLDLKRPVGLREGDGLRLDGGGWVAVRAAPEALLEIAAADERHLARIAWHLGNRHCPAEIREDRIYIRDDHVVAEMVRGLGGAVSPVHRPFNPEGGAYEPAVHRHG
jgi:urease accessory protein